MRYYVHINGGNQGPVTLEELQKLVADGTVVATTFVAAEGSQSWIKASEVLGLFVSPLRVDSTPERLGSANQRQESHLAGNVSGQSIGSAVKGISLKTGVLVLFTFCSASFLTLIYVDRLSSALRNSLNSHSKCLQRGYVSFLAIATGLSMQFQLWGLTFEINGLYLVGSLLSMVAGAAMIYWAFGMRKMIRDYCTEKQSLNFQTNRVYTFLFNVFYINYCINELREMEESGKL